MTTEIQVKERPILFSGAMVRALLAGTKTQTRRVCKDQPGTVRPSQYPHPCYVDGNGRPMVCPYGQPGDRLWVRETHVKYGSGWIYRADYGDKTPVSDGIGGPWKPSIFMRREACRILLEIVSVRVERLQAISEEDAVAEGIEKTEAWGGDWTWYQDYLSESNQLLAIESYRSLWTKINGPDSWAANPWVWVVEFKRIEL